MYSTKTFEKLHELETGTIRYRWYCLYEVAVCIALIILALCFTNDTINLMDVCDFVNAISINEG